MIDDYTINFFPIQFKTKKDGKKEWESCVLPCENVVIDLRENYAGVISYFLLKNDPLGANFEKTEE